MIFTSSPQVETQEAFHREAGMPSFKIRVVTGTGFMQSSRFPIRLATEGVADLAGKKISATVVFDPE